MSKPNTITTRTHAGVRVLPPGGRNCPRRVTVSRLQHGRHRDSRRVHEGCLLASPLEFARILNRTSTEKAKQQENTDVESRIYTDSQTGCCRYRLGKTKKKAKLEMQYLCIDQTTPRSHILQHQCAC